jgi:hypothetical protein
VCLQLLSLLGLEILVGDDIVAHAALSRTLSLGSMTNHILLMLHMLVVRVPSAFFNSLQPASDESAIDFNDKNKIDKKIRLD